MLKIQKGRYIAVSVVCAIFLIVGIVFALLPYEVYVNWGIDKLNARYYPLIACGVLDFFVLLFMVMFIRITKYQFRLINRRMSKFGEDSIALKGKIVDHKAAIKNAIYNVFSYILAMLSALIMFFGVYKVSINYVKRWFILYSEGIYVLNMKDESEFLIKKMDVSEIKIKEKRNKLVVELIPLKYNFIVKTKGLDITKEELIAKLKEVFTNPAPDPNSYKYV